MSEFAVGDWVSWYEIDDETTKTGRVLVATDVWYAISTEDGLVYWKHKRDL